MLAFVKDDKLVVNTQIHQCEKQELLNYIDLVNEYGVVTEQLYDIEGNVSGIAFKINRD